ncbi:MAG TPA: DedA family protein [Terriglobales bacterium]|nr:DedA family protein [Terriglobales bacterium]
MAEWFFELLRGYFDQYGYWTVAVALLLENAGLPVPGETVLLFASFLAYSERELSLPWIIVVGTVAATLGDNLGYALGRRGGRPLLERYKHWFRISDRNVQRGERIFTRYGSAAIFFARFIFGLRIIAGPLAGVLHMRWKQFALFNFLGAAVWVTVIALVGYFFDSQWDRVLRVLKDVDTGIFIASAGVILILWLRRRRRKALRKAAGGAAEDQK